MPAPPEIRLRRMVDEQLRGRDIADPRVLEAMERVPREAFVPPDLRRRAYDDAALPIGSGQTISQPYMVARILQELGLDGDERALDVGTGSGYQAAVLAQLAQEVHSIERIPELAEQARRNLEAAGIDNVEVHVGDGSRGLPDQAPFDAIAVAAAAPDVPNALYDQLKVGGPPRRAGREAARPAPRGHRAEPGGPGRDPLGAVPLRPAPRRGGVRGVTDARARVVIRGRVQGVFFRVETRERARSLGLAGWVRNNPDGTVEAVFQGDRDRVDSMLAWCRRGPAAAHVEDVEVEWTEPRDERGFATR